MKKLFLVLIVMMLLSVQGALAANLPVRAYGNDTVAGYAAMLKSSLLTPGQKVVFTVEKPDKSVVRIPAEADLEGMAKAELFGHQTKVTGTYKVAIVYPGSADASPQNTFSVYPDAVSATQSTLTVAQALLPADGASKTFVTVALFDAYRNPISRHAVKLISSRGEDTIEALTGGVTDAKGQANFKVTSVYPGLSVFSALDQTMNVLLTDREEVVFQAPAFEPRAIGGNLLQANVFEADLGQGAPVASGPVARFEIEGLPAQVKVNEQLNFTLVALDRDGNTAKNYTGTVLFAIPNDENAVLPSNGEYVFKERDQGRFTFNLALQFSELGHQTVQVFDKDNWDIKGEVEVEVVSAQTLMPASTGTRLQIKSPVDGAELGNSFVLLSGQGLENINLKVFDNDSKIGDSETDLEGFFSFEAKGLESGAHSFYVMSESGDVSSSVAVLIDTLPPVLNSFSVYPEGNVKPAERLSVTVQSEPGLEGVKVRFQGISQDLLPGADPGTYEGTLAAPSKAGSFPLDVILADKLGNKAELLNQRTLKVAEAEPLFPPTVQGLTGEAGDSVVKLSWKAATGHASPIAHYRVYYGTHFDALKDMIETPGAETAATVSGLLNDTQTFFAVKAVDSKGVESKEASVTIGVTPQALAVTPLPGPAAVPSAGYQAIPFDSGVALSWPSFPQSYYYKVYFGLKSGQYDDFLLTRNNTPALQVADLINGLPYYFSVAALDLAGREVSSLSPEFSGTPGAGGLYAAAPYPASSLKPLGPIFPLGKVPATQDTGPEALWIFGIALILAHFLYHHTKRIRHAV